LRSTDTADIVQRAIDEAFAEEPSMNAAKSAGIKTDKVADEIAAALRDLFDGKDTRGTGQTFDEEIYAKAKPLFDRLMNHGLEQEAEQQADHQSILRTIAKAQRMARDRKP
jgi:hypothetical protein